MRGAAGHPFFVQTSTGHGRTEVRQLHAFALEALAADFPFARSVVVVRSEVTEKKTGKTTAESRYYLASAEPAERTPAQWQGLVRGHWGGVEIRNHWRRDAIWREDGSRTRDATALANLALVRNALLALLPEHYAEVSLPEIHEQLHSDPGECFRVISSK